MAEVIQYEWGWKGRAGNFALVVGTRDVLDEAMTYWATTMCLGIEVRSETRMSLGHEGVRGLALSWNLEQGVPMNGVRPGVDPFLAAGLFRNRCVSSEQGKLLLLGTDSEAIAEAYGEDAVPLVIPDLLGVSIDGAPYGTVGVWVDGFSLIGAQSVEGQAEAMARVGREAMLVFGKVQTGAATVELDAGAVLGMGDAQWPRDLSPLVALALVESNGWDAGDEVRAFAQMLERYGAIGHARVTQNEAREETSTSSAQQDLPSPVIADASAARGDDDVRDLQGHKMEAVGQLAAGVAHEINTPVQYIGDSVDFLSESWRVVEELIGVGDELANGRVSAAVWEDKKKELDLEFYREEAPGAISRAKDGVSRVATIVKAMKAFAHPDSDEMRPANLNDGIKSTLIVAKNEVKYVAELVTEYGDLPPVTCWQGHINQVVLNLVVNAAHAIADRREKTGDKSMGRVTVQTLKVEGNRVQIRVSDTGTGIAPEHQQKIWDMFFTTKEVGRGTGHGLAIARRIVERHGGKIWFETEVGVGTTFIVELVVNETPGVSGTQG